MMMILLLLLLLIIIILQTIAFIETAVIYPVIFFA
jgi:hypothetical protein